MRGVLALVAMTYFAATSTSPTPFSRPCPIDSNDVTGIATSHIARLPNRRSKTAVKRRSVSPAFEVSPVTAASGRRCEITGSRTNSFSGNAFSVKIGRGKLRLPLGQPVSLQKPRMWRTNPRMVSALTASPNAGISDDSPTAGPPWEIASSQSASGSAVVTWHSVKSIGSTVTVGSATRPEPSAAWQRAHHASHISGTVTGCACEPSAATTIATPITSR